MPRPVLVEHAVELPVTPDEVGRELLDLGATDHGDGIYSLPIENDPAADGGLTARVEANDDGTTRVDLAATNGIRLPFFHSIVTSVVMVQYDAAVARLAGQLEHRLAGAPEARIKPVRRNPLLPPVPYTQTQAVGLATAGFAVAIATFGQAIVAQYSKPIQETFFGLHHTDFKLAVVLTVIRLGAFGALFGGVLTDRIGRRRLILLSLFGLAIANLLTALSFDAISFTVLQTLSRGCALTAVFAGSVIALEEAPERARGFATSMLALAGGFGFTFAVILLPLLGKGEKWRFVFVLSGLAGILTWRVGKFLKESPRFETVESMSIRRGRIGEVLGRQYRSRFILLALIGFLTNILSAPSSTYTNNYLSTNHHYSNLAILEWRTATTSWTGLIGLALAGALVERYGRRPTALVTILIGGIVRLVFFLGGGPMLWIASGLGDMMFACGFLAIATLNVELFPTESRGTSIGLVNVVGVFGSMLGTLAAGYISNNGAWGKALAICTIPTIIAAVLVVPFLPETKGRVLDEISPSEA